MHFPFVFNSFISHTHGLFFERHQVYCSTRNPLCCLFSPENFIFPSCTPHSLQTIRHAHFPFSKLSFSNSTIVSLFLRRRWKMEKKKLQVLLRSGVKVFLALHRVLCSLSTFLWAGVKIVSLYKTYKTWYCNSPKEEYHFSYWDIQAHIPKMHWWESKVTKTP